MAGKEVSVSVLAHTMVEVPARTVAIATSVLFIGRLSSASCRPPQFLHRRNGKLNLWAASGRAHDRSRIRMFGSVGTILLAHVFERTHQFEGGWRFVGVKSVIRLTLCSPVIGQSGVRFFTMHGVMSHTKVTYGVRDAQAR